MKVVNLGRGSSEILINLVLKKSPEGEGIILFFRLIVERQTEEMRRPDCLIFKNVREKA